MQERIPLWTSIKREGLTGYAEDRMFFDKRPLSNLSELLGLGYHEGLRRMMRMSGMDEALITSGASDYDMAEALCRAIPLWAGHPYVGAINHLLSCVLGIEASLRLDTLPMLWKAVGKALLERQLCMADLPGLLGIQRVITPVTIEALTLIGEESSFKGQTSTLHIDDPSGRALWASSLCQPLDPKNGGKLMIEAVERLADICVTRGILGITVNLQSLTSFARPNPYTPALFAVALQKGEHLDDGSKILLACQFLRLLGGACSKRNMTVTLADIPTHALLPLLEYLSSCHCLPQLIIAGKDPAAALEAGISSLLRVDLPMARGTYLACLEDLACHVPLGCIHGLYAPMQGPVDLPLYADLCHTLCQQAETWSAE